MGGEEEDQPSAGKGEGLIDREVLGMIVRAAWVDWARAQPNPRESWVIPWDSLADEIKEVDRRVGESVEEYVLDALELATKMKQASLNEEAVIRSLPMAPIDAERLHELWEAEPQTTKLTAAKLRTDDLVSKAQERVAQIDSMIEDNEVDGTRLPADHPWRVERDTLDWVLQQLDATTVD